MLFLEICIYKNTVKPVKVPYGYSEVEQVLVQSLKNEKYWFSYDQFLTLRDSLSDDFKLGLVLTNGPFAVIDNYQKYQPLDAMLISMLEKGAYIEISPSGRGLHIFFRDEWPYDRKKNHRLLGNKVPKMTYEVYSGTDVRFITLTGQRLQNKGAFSDTSTALSSCKDLKDEGMFY
uniref:DNA primase/polymerase bifunctional N-terminal domain-containing protein n=1 Tax=Melanthalia intermedia TaxID=172989 RepID=A0A345UAN8_9FLOR|nr:hypothetical protein [Melanthalia intermedia]AXI97524.1 hypothetical protein [Melanthalia intermedia]